MNNTVRHRVVAAKAPKYRASCDLCNEAKVRCSQARPICARCLKNNICCVYGVSQRSGKQTVEAYQARRRNTTQALPTPVTTTDTTESVVEPQASPLLSPLDTDDPEGLKQQFTGWALDNLYVPNESSTYQDTAFDYNNYPVFGRDELQSWNLQSQQRPSPPQHLDDRTQLISSASLPSHNPVSSTGLDHKRSPVFDSILVPRNTYDEDDSLMDHDRNIDCMSCTSNGHILPSAPFGTCRCNGIVIAQLATLPVLLHRECSAFDVRLVQFKEAINLCKGVLKCTCVGKDYTAILTISLLISRIISVLERGGGLVGQEEDMWELEKGSDSPGMRGPKFSLGVFPIDGDDERGLKQEVCWLQMKKAKSLVAGFQEMVRKIREQQVHQDTAQAAAWEKLIVLLDQKAQAVDREWTASRDRA